MRAVRSSLGGWRRCISRLSIFRGRQRTTMSSGGPQILHDLPPGISLLQRICTRRRSNRLLWYQSSILILTYFAYMCYHLTRKPISVVKNVLHQNCSSLIPPANIHINPSNNATWCDWAPFDGSDGDATKLLGTIDSAFLFAYAAAMFVSGFIAERVNLRYFLALGMMFSGVFSYLFGIARSYDIHAFSYFIVIQIAAGITQTTGWPGVVTVVGKWFGKGKRGLIFGIWNSHTSIGNILGTVIAARFVETDWSLSFIVPGVIMALGGFLIFLFLVDDPADVGLSQPDLATGSINTNKRDLYRRLETGDHLSDGNEQSDTETEAPILTSDQGQSSSAPTESTTLLGSSSRDSSKAIGFIGALKIPGVIEFSLSLCFGKLVSYTFLYWLPLYIKNSTTMTPKQAADASTLFDVGGIIGAILAGVICDYTGRSATICATMLLLAAPTMLLYEWFGNLEFGFVLLLLVGLLVNGPYALITTSISAELGTHSSLEGNSKALATVTAIIDGTGSIGAAIGPLLAGVVSAHGWSHVFYMLIFCDILALILLLRLVLHEMCGARNSRNGPIE